MACLAIPKEDGEFEIYASTQDLAGMQRWCAQVTGSPRNRIVAKSKRLGGGFGGKESRPAQLGAIVALAAKVTRRPVRCMLERWEGEATSPTCHHYFELIFVSLILFFRYSNNWSKTSHARQLESRFYE